MVAATIVSPNFSFRIFFLGPIQLKYIVWFLLLLSFLDLSGAYPAESIANLGGALVGYLYAKKFNNYPVLRPLLKCLKSAFQKKKLKVSHKNTSLLKHQEKKKNNLIDQTAIDQILDKIAASGYESLTPDEKHQLFHAGKSTTF